jgi:hypothetical protein
LHQYLDNLILWIETIAGEMEKGRKVTPPWIEKTEDLFGIVESMSNIVSDTCPGYRSGEFLEGLRKARDEVMKGFERGPEGLYRSVYSVREVKDRRLPKALRR